MFKNHSPSQSPQLNLLSLIIEMLVLVIKKTGSVIEVIPIKMNIFMMFKLYAYLFKQLQYSFHLIWLGIMGSYSYCQKHGYKPRFLIYSLFWLFKCVFFWLIKLKLSNHEILNSFKFKSNWFWKYTNWGIDGVNKWKMLVRSVTRHSSLALSFVLARMNLDAGDFNPKKYSSAHQ